MERVLVVLTDRVSRGLDVAQSEIHGRNIVIANLDEAPVDIRSYDTRQNGVECKVSDILDVIIRRRLVYVVLPTTAH